MTSDLLDAIIKNGLSNIFRVEHAQYFFPTGTEHNFAVVRPYGYKVKWGTADPNVLLFDPWVDLLPRAYLPGKGHAIGALPGNPLRHE